MIVCICHAVPDGTIRQAAGAGLGAEDIARQTQAGTSCGCCAETVARIVAESHRCRRQGAERCPGCRQ